MDELLKDFLTETTEHIEGAETQLVQFERNPTDASLISSIFRLVHTIKGTSSFLGLERLERVGHAAESVMGMLRDGVPPTQHSVTIILAAIDRIKNIIEDIARTGSEPAEDDSEIIAALEAYYAAGSAAPVEDAAPAAASTPEPVHVQETPVHAPAVAAAEPAAPAAPVAAAPAAPQPEPAKAKAPSKEKEEASGDKSKNHNQETIRVSVDTIERMMQLVSELVLSRNQLLEIARHRDDDAIKTPLQHLSTLTSDLQDAVMRARMQPVGRLYANLPRLVRELSTSLGKNIDLVTEGADTELDRQLIEVIRDPLTHLIRNCADHGIETTGRARCRRQARDAARSASPPPMRPARSPSTSSTTAKASTSSASRQKILSQGLATEQELKAMSIEEIYRFIFEAGFSTAQVVSNVSGRGVGMDVVRSNIEAIGGSVSLYVGPGQGQPLLAADPADARHRAGPDHRGRRPAFRPAADLRRRGREPRQELQRADPERSERARPEAPRGGHSRRRAARRSRTCRKPRWRRQREARRRHARRPG